MGKMIFLMFWPKLKLWKYVHLSLIIGFGKSSYRVCVVHYVRDNVMLLPFLEYEGIYLVIQPLRITSLNVMLLLMCFLWEKNNTFAWLLHVQLISCCSWMCSFLSRIFWCLTNLWIVILGIILIIFLTFDTFFTLKLGRPSLDVFW